MPKHVGDLMSTINCLQHPSALVGFFHWLVCVFYHLRSTCLITALFLYIEAPCRWQQVVVETCMCTFVNQIVVRLVGNKRVCY
jgi:hypothetical protein